ncbi:MAG: hypothetical protein N3E37_00580 [Candidatus Micrarchaeota archaeon]|nr:hypothetical protein [Candidatus Micrarchaeota archaeon]
MSFKNFFHKNPRQKPSEEYNQNNFSKNSPLIENSFQSFFLNNKGINYYNIPLAYLRATRAYLISLISERMLNQEGKKQKVRIILPYSCLIHSNTNNMNFAVLSYSKLDKRLQDFVRRFCEKVNTVVDDAFRFSYRAFTSDNLRVIYYSSKAPESIANLYYKRFGLGNFIFRNYLSVPTLISEVTRKRTKVIRRFKKKTHDLFTYYYRDNTYIYSHNNAVKSFRENDRYTKIKKIMKEYNQVLEEFNRHYDRINQRFSEFFSENKVSTRSFMLSFMNSLFNDSGTTNTCVNQEKLKKLKRYLKSSIFVLSEYLLSYRDILIDNPYEMCFSIAYILFTEKKRLEMSNNNNLSEDSKKKLTERIDNIIRNFGFLFEKADNNIINTNSSTNRTLAVIYYDYLEEIQEFEKKVPFLFDSNFYRNIKSDDNIFVRIINLKTEMERKIDDIYREVLAYSNTLKDLNISEFDQELVTINSIFYHLKHTFFYTSSDHVRMVIDLVDRGKITAFIRGVMNGSKTDSPNSILENAERELVEALKMSDEEVKCFDKFSSLLRDSITEEERIFSTLNQYKQSIFKEVLSINEEEFQIIKEMLLLQLMITTTHGYYKSQIPMKMDLDSFIYNPYLASMLILIKASFIPLYNQRSSAIDNVIGRLDGFTRVVNEELSKYFSHVHLPLSQPFFAYDNGVPISEMTYLKGNITKPQRRQRSNSADVSSQEISNDELVCFVDLSAIKSYSSDGEKEDSIVGIVIGDSVYFSKSRDKQLFYTFADVKESVESSTVNEEVSDALRLFVISNDLYKYLSEIKIVRDSEEYKKLVRDYIDAHRQRYINGYIVVDSTAKHVKPAILQGTSYSPNKSKEQILGVFYSNIIASSLIYQQLNSNSD